MRRLLLGMALLLVGALHQLPLDPVALSLRWMHLFSPYLSLNISPMVLTPIELRSFTSGKADG